MVKINRKEIYRFYQFCLLIFGFLVSMFVQWVTNLFVEEEPVKESAPVEEKLTREDYAKYGLDESGNILVMMYHGIHDIPSSQTRYIGEMLM